ncbi:hypothetical protein D3C72_1100250 [compost metagenome]
MIFCIYSVSCCFYTKQLHRCIFYKRIEHPNRITSSSYSSNNKIRKSSFRLQNLTPCLIPDNSLEVTHHHWIRVWACSGPKNIECILYMTDPITECFITSIFEGTGTGYNWNYFSAKQLHPKHIKLLTFHVLFTHEHFTFKAKQCSNRCCGNPVLPCPGLSNNLRLAHPFGQNPLTYRIIDLMSSCMVQIFTLKVNLGSAQVR